MKQTTYKIALQPPKTLQGWIEPAKLMARHNNILWVDWTVNNQSVKSFFINDQNKIIQYNREQKND